MAADYKSGFYVVEEQMKYSSIELFIFSSLANIYVEPTTSRGLIPSYKNNDDRQYLQETTKYNSVTEM